MEPYNYSLPQTAQRPDAFGQGFVQGQALKQQDQERVQQQQMLDAFGQISQNPTVANISSAMGRFPQLSEKFKPLLDSATAQQKQNHIRQASDIFMMLGSGKREMAIKTLQEHADAARNAGDEGAARSAEVMKNLIESSETGESGDKHVMALSGMYLAAAMGPEEFMKTYEGLLKMPSTMSEAEAKAQEAQATAQKAATAAKFAESDAALDLQKKGWDIAAIQNDIEVKKQNVKIAALNAQTSRETNELKRQELGLQVQKAVQERDEKVRGKVAEVTSLRGGIDNMLSTVQVALDTPKDIFDASVGPIAGKVPAIFAGPTNMTAINDFREVMTTLQSQTMLEQLKELKAAGATMGALNAPEGEALRKCFVNLSTTQGPERLRANLAEAKRLLIKARGNLTTKYGVPEIPVDLRPGTDPNQKVVDVNF